MLIKTVWIDFPLLLNPLLSPKINPNAFNFRGLQWAWWIPSIRLLRLLWSRNVILSSNQCNAFFGWLTNHRPGNWHCRMNFIRSRRLWRWVALGWIRGWWQQVSFGLKIIGILSLICTSSTRVNVNHRSIVLTYLWNFLNVVRRNMGQNFILLFIIHILFFITHKFVQWWTKWLLSSLHGEH